MNKTAFNDHWYEQRLAAPSHHIKPLQVVIDTDAANEIDDQFALAWALRCPQQLNIQAIYATPFSFAHRRSQLAYAPGNAAPFGTPEQGMQRSYDEIERVLKLLEQDQPLKNRPAVLRGASHYLTGETEQHNQAALDLIERARRSTESPLYVLALGCVTNVSQALMMAPDIAKHIVVVWTSGFPIHAPYENVSFNLEQDMVASQYLFACGVPLVYLPGYHVGAQLRLSLAEMDRYVKGTSHIGNYLHELYTHNPLWEIMREPYKKPPDQEPYSWVIWDIICVAWLVNPDWVTSELVRTPLFGQDKRWQMREQAPWMRQAYAVKRDDIFQAMIKSL
jgi:purine nucleosidase